MARSRFPAPQFHVPSGDVQLAVYRWGRPAPDRPVVLLVHGYPDSARVWQATAEALAADHTVYAYDVRGAGASTVPRRVDDYRLERLAADMAAVVDTLAPGGEPVHLVGHDWGSIQSWEAVCTEPLASRLASFTTVSGPCLDHAAHWIRARMGSMQPRQWSEVARQFGHSWYVMLFQLPLLAPAAWQLGLGQRWPELLGRLEGIRADTSPTQTADGRHGVNLYRANFTERLLRPRERRTKVPVQLIVPTGDPFMVRSINDDLGQWAPRLLRHEVEAGHWLPLTRPELLAGCVRDFVSGLSPPRPRSAPRRRASPRG